jgi:hypothetical protein
MHYNVTMESRSFHIVLVLVVAFQLCDFLLGARANRFLEVVGRCVGGQQLERLSRGLQGQIVLTVGEVGIAEDSGRGFASWSALLHGQRIH